MPRLRTRCPIILLAGAALVAEPAVAAPDPALAQQLQAKTQAMVDAIATGDKAVWDAALDPAVVYVTEDGVVKTKAQYLSDLAPLPAELSGQIRVGDFKLDRQGTTAVASYVDYENLDYYGQLIRTRFRVTDVWIQKPDGWKLIASQTLALLDDPPAVVLSPAIAAQYAGQYELTLDIHYLITVVGNRVIAQRQGGKLFEMKAEAPDVFFFAGKPRERWIFQRDAAGKVVALVDRRGGTISSGRGCNRQIPLPPEREGQSDQASSSRVTATSALAERRTLSPSISAIRPCEI